jgi:CubicO group peptidase (beta-lactamase class C family)
MPMEVARFALVLVLVAVAGRSAETGASDEQRIARVEGGLLPAITFKGEAGRPADILSRMRHHKIPGLSVAVIEGGQLRWARGYGVTAAGGHTPVTPATLFQAGAASRSVAAMAALLLVQDGRLGLDEDVNSRLTSWKVPQNEFTAAKKVTLRRLLSHTAGVTLDGFPGYPGGAPLPSLLQVLDGTEPARSSKVDVDLVPGSEFRPSAGGYVIVQQLLQDVSGEPFHRLAQRIVLSRLAMNNSTYEQPLPPGRAAEAASGHRADGAAVEGGWRAYPEQAAAGLWTTPSDLARFAIEVRGAGAERVHQILSPESARLMLTPQLGRCALGLFVDGAADAEHFSHAGRNAGFDTVMVMYTHRGDGAVLMINANNNAGFVAEVLDSVAKEYGWPGHRPTPQREVVRVDPVVLRRYHGSYRLGANSLVEVRCEEDRLFATFPGLGTVELFAESPNDFFITTPNLKITFAGTGADAATTTTLIVKANGQSQTATRTHPGG